MVPELVQKIQGAPRADDEFERSALFHAFAIQMNLISPLWFAIRVYRQMKTQDGLGSIVNISSGAGHPAGSPTLVSYGAAKSGLNHLTRSLAEEWGDHARVNCLALGPTMTDNFAQFVLGDDPEGARYFQNVPLGRAGTPTEVGRAVGWGRPMGEPSHPADVRRAVAVFEDGVHVLADCVGITLDEVICHVEFAAATRDLDLPRRPIAKGAVAGLDVRFIGVVDGAELVELHQRWVMDTELDPPMPASHGYRIEVDGSPQVNLDLGLLPDQPLETFTVENMHAIGMTITGMPIVHAVPKVVAAPPGIVTYADIALPAGHLRRPAPAL